jgi:hypothetical protein
MKKVLLILMVSAVYALHQDFWNWNKVKPLVMGFLPQGLAYHAGFSLLAALMMAVLVKFAWPAELDQTETKTPAESDDPDVVSPK